MNDGVTWANSVLSQAPPWKCSGKGFTPALVSLLRCSSTVFTTSLVSVGTKSIVAFGPFSKDTVSALLQETFLCEQRGDCTDSSVSFTFLNPSFLCRFLHRAASLYPSRHPPRLSPLAQSVLPGLVVLLLLCVRLPFFLVFVASACCAPVYA